jgi:hypothetical protein
LNIVSGTDLIFIIAIGNKIEFNDY